jgi:predicted DCC family thiol-disulfide oxidoreductase YuxK
MNLPVGVVVMAKVIAIWMALSFSPFHLTWALRATAIAAIAALLLNLRVRAACFALGAAHLLAILPARTGVHNATILLACMLILAALYPPRFGAPLMRLAVALLYLAAALHGYTTAAHPLAWAIVALEFSLAALFLIPRFLSFAIWTSILAQSATIVFIGERVFSYPILAAMPALIEWPKPMQVIYDGDCAICTRIRHWWERIDFDRLFTWTPLQSQAAARFGIPKQRLVESLHFIAGNTVTRGFRACKRMLMYHPAAWLLLAAALSIPGPVIARDVTIVGAILFFLPLSEPIGERVYRWIAANRHRISSHGACAADGNRPRQG